jgi:hypothetical protein
MKSFSSFIGLAPVAEHPPGYCRYERVHVLPLSMFGHLVTMDVLGHMTSVALSKHDGNPAAAVELPPWPAMTTEGDVLHSSPLADLQDANPARQNGAAWPPSITERMQFHKGVYARMGVHHKHARRWGKPSNPHEGYMELQVRPSWSCLPVLSRVCPLRGARLYSGAPLPCMIVPILSR